MPKLKYTNILLICFTIVFFAGTNLMSQTCVFQITDADGNKTEQDSISWPDDVPPGGLADCISNDGCTKCTPKVVTPPFLKCDCIDPGCCYYEETIDCIDTNSSTMDKATCEASGGQWFTNAVCNPETSQCDQVEGEENDTENRFGSSFVTGNGKFGEGNRSITVSRYDNNSKKVWSKSYGTAGPNNGHAITVDEFGNSYAVGKMTELVKFDTEAFASLGKEDIFLVKNNLNGEEQWAKRFGSSEKDEATEVCLDQQGNIYVVGVYKSTCYFEGTTLSAEDAGFNGFIAKYNPNGSQQWVLPIGGAGNERVNSIAYGSDGYLYLTGSYSTEAHFGDLILTAGAYQNTFIAKLNTDGDFVWAEKVEKENYSTSGNALELDVLNNIYIAGTSHKEDNKQSFLLKYSPTGNLLKDRSLESYGTLFQITGLTLVKATGKIQMIGIFKGDISFDGINLINMGAQDVFLGQINTNLIFDWARNEGGNKSDYGWRISNDDEGFTSYVGCTFGISTLEGIIQVGDSKAYYRRFDSQRLATSIDDQALTPFHLSIAPNPFDDYLDLSFSNANNINVVIELFDINGKLMQQEEAVLASGSNNFRFGLKHKLNSGIYLLRIISERGEVLSKKVIKD